MIHHRAFDSLRSRPARWWLLVAMAMLAGCGSSAARDAASAAVLATGAAADVAAASWAGREAFAGDFEAFEGARTQCDAVAAAPPKIKSLLARMGDSPEAAEARTRLAEVERLTRDWMEACTVLAEARDDLLALHDAAGDFDAGAPALQALLDLAARQLVEADQPSQVYLIARQALLVERLRGGIQRVLAGGAGAISAADRLSRDQAVFNMTLTGLLQGSRELAIEAVADPAALEHLRQVRTQFDAVEASLTLVVDRAVGVLETREALDTQHQQGSDLVASLRQLSARLLEVP